MLEQGPHDGTVKNVTGDKVTIQPDHGSELTLTVDSGADLRKDGEPTTLGSFTPGSPVRFVYDRETDQLTWLGVYVAIQRPPLQ